MFKKFRLRFARKRDAKEVAKLFREIDSKFDWRDLIHLIGEKKVVVLRDKQKTLGAFSFIKIGLGLFSLLYIRKLVVDKNFRGKGLGGKILRKLRVFTRKRKAGGFLLWALPPAKNFYRKNRLKSWWRFFWWRKD
ncbi:GNAT family N-acetyltransferase [Candidatus Gracilibacteria bacterium]|nr:GNAT family N-acetyltransferase [Candidatus Gracilibacteria bacterium]MCF7856524.1 GNAT family N-acetyltransferase [Candidatus Gracilibacteria bacterium]MCF7896580.1 GNAT family N-acetyltransferase [Candidatus Gracilibacteria bacterium]